jgi:hypothetical protein
MPHGSYYGINMVVLALPCDASSQKNLTLCHELHLGCLSGRDSYASDLNFPRSCCLQNSTIIKKHSFETPEAASHQVASTKQVVANKTYDAMQGKGTINFI